MTTVDFRSYQNQDNWLSLVKTGCPPSHQVAFFLNHHGDVEIRHGDHSCTLSFPLEASEYHRVQGMAAWIKLVHDYDEHEDER